MTDPTTDKDPTATGAKATRTGRNGHATNGAGDGDDKPKRTRAASPAAAPEEGPAVTAIEKRPAPTLVPITPTNGGAGTEVIRTERLEITQGGANRVDAGSVSITQGGIGEATAGRVEIRQGGIGRLESEETSVTQGGIGFVRADRVNLELGGIGAAIANDVRVTQGAAGMVLARQATVQQGLVRTLVAQEVRFDKPSGVLVMLAARVSGEVRPVLDWRGGLAFGASFAVVTGLIRGARARR